MEKREYKKFTTQISFVSCDQPMLLIDDECDSASIDISKNLIKDHKIFGMRNNKIYFNKLIHLKQINL